MVYVQLLRKEKSGDRVQLQIKNKDSSVAFSVSGTADINKVFEVIWSLLETELIENNHDFDKLYEKMNKNKRIIKKSQGVK